MVTRRKNSKIGKTLAQIAKFIGGEVVGDKDLIVTALSGLQEAQVGELSFVANSKYFPLAKQTKASALIIARQMNVSFFASSEKKSFILVDNPSFAFTQIATLLNKNNFPPVLGIHPSAIIEKGVRLGKNISIGAYTVIERQAEIGDNVVIYSHGYVGYHSHIGKNCLIYPHVTIREATKIGERVIIHSGAVIGSDGFGFDQANGENKKIPQLGTVVIEDDVEIGANVTIARARFDKTIIGKGTKIDNLVQIGHNVVMGENCIVVAQVGVAGSARVGKNTILAGQSGVVGHVTIGEGSIVAAQSAVLKSIPAFSKVSGFPARPHVQAKRVNAALQRLPLYVKKIQMLENKINELEKRLNNG